MSKTASFGDKGANCVQQFFELFVSQINAPQEGENG